MLTPFGKIGFAAALATAVAAQAETLPSANGIVQRYLLNPHGEIEGLLLQAGLTVRFPPHLAAALAKSAKPGDTVGVVGFFGPETAAGQCIKALSITNIRTGVNAVDRPPLRPRLPPELRGPSLDALAAEGRVARMIVNDKGDVDGLVLNGGEEIRFPPHNGPTVVFALAGQPQQNVVASGYGTRNRFGTVIDAYALSIGGRPLALSGKGRTGR